MPLFSCMAANLYLSISQHQVQASQHQALLDSPLASAAQGLTVIWSVGEPRCPECHEMWGSSMVWESMHGNYTGVLLLEMGKVRHRRSRQYAHDWQHENSLLLSSIPVLSHASHLLSSTLLASSLKNGRTFLSTRWDFSSRNTSSFPGGPLPEATNQPGHS